MRHGRSLATAPLICAALSFLVAASAAAQGTFDAAKLKGLEWRNVGPANHSGRIADLAVARAPGIPDALYVAEANGGVWKTTDWGATWDPVFDSAHGMGSIGSVTVAPSNPNVVWVGTGEVDNRQSSYWGDGIYKSVDAGRTWKHMGLEATQHIGRIIVDPTNPDIVYVAALGHLWGSNPERGVYKTTDGGATWNKVLYVDENTGASTMVMDPHDPQTLIVAMYERQRKAWGYNGGGTGSGIFRTNDGGRTWTRLTNGLPSGPLGRIGLDIYKRDGRIIYATIEADPPGGRGAEPIAHPKGGIYRTTDRGDSWEQVNTLTVRPSYFSLIRIDPNDPQRIYDGGTDFMTSSDGGRTFVDPGYGGQELHPDQHALWIDPDNSNHLIAGNDGGVYFSYSAGKTWKFVDNIPTAEFYDVSADMRDPYYICGGLQDNGSWCTATATRDVKGITRGDAYLVGGGDGYFVQIHPTDPNIIFAEQGGGSVARFNRAAAEAQSVRPVSDQRPTPGAQGGGTGALRGNWDAPILMSSFDPRTVYVGMNKLMRTRDLGVTWTAISPDLTYNVNRDTLEMMGSRVPRNALSRNDGISTFSTLTAIAESPLNQNVLYTGSDDGQVQVTRDGGTTWKNVSLNIPGVPRFTWVSWVAASKASPGRVYVAFDGHRNDDFHPYLYVSNDFGGTWRAITNGLPSTVVNAICEDPTNTNLLFVGTARGVDMSVNSGGEWVSLNTNLPSIPVDAVIIHPRDHDLIIATHGRSFWILDDIRPLEELTSERVASGDHALPGKPGRLTSFWFGDGWFLAGHYEAPNPPYGADIAYWLGAAAKSVQVRVMDGSGTLVRTLDAPGEAGVNRVYWDLHYEPAEKPDPKEPYNAVFRPPPEGPPVLPGAYTAVIAVPGRGELKVPVTVLADPKTTISEADRKTRQAALMRLYAMEKTLVTARGTDSVLEAQMVTLKKALGGASAGGSGAAAPEDARREAKAVADSVSAAGRAIASNLGTASQLARSISGFTGLPTPSQTRSIGWAHDDLVANIGKLNRLLQKEIPELYASLRSRNVWPSPVRAIPLPAQIPSP
jgi:photosystem II stability/assembly factor-like uncharacterized protein